MKVRLPLLLLAIWVTVAACTTSQPLASAASAEEALKSLPPVSDACRAAAPTVRPLRVADIPEHLIREGRSGWAVIRYSIEGGSVSDISVAASSLGGAYNSLAVQHVKKNVNPMSPNAVNCLAAVTVRLSPS